MPSKHSLCCFVLASLKVRRFPERNYRCSHFLTFLFPQKFHLTGWSLQSTLLYNSADLFVDFQDILFLSKLYNLWLCFHTVCCNVSSFIVTLCYTNFKYTYVVIWLLQNLSDNQEYLKFIKKKSHFVKVG